MLYHICTITQAFSASLKNREPYLKNHEQGLATPTYLGVNIKKTNQKNQKNQNQKIIFCFYRTIWASKS